MALSPQHRVEVFIVRFPLDKTTTKKKDKLANSGLTTSKSMLELRELERRERGRGELFAAYVLFEGQDGPDRMVKRSNNMKIFRNKSKKEN